MADNMYDSFNLENAGIHLLFDEIDQISAKNACEFILKSNCYYNPDQELTLMVNSPGGDLYAGFAIIDMMQASALKIKTVAIGHVMSMGLIIFMSGTKGRRVMTANTSVMAHQIAAGLYGKHHELISVSRHYNKISERLMDHYKKYTNMTESQIKDILMNPSDVYLTPEQCLEYGICDKIVDNISESVEDNNG